MNQKTKKKLCFPQGVSLLVLLLFVIINGCSLHHVELPADPDITPHYSMDRKGRDTSSTYLANLYTPTSLSDIDFPDITDSLIQALHNHQRLLKIRKQLKIQHIDNLEISVEDMKRTIATLLQIKEEPDSISNLVAYQIAGQKKTGNVKFTGYYTPLIQVRKKKTKTFKYPIYSKPAHFIGDLPTRKAIDFEGALEGQGLELAYAKDRMDIYFMQLQGSGYVQYKDGSKQMFGYGGSNGHAYRSIGRYLKSNDYSISSISQKGIRNFLSKRPDLLPEILAANTSYSFFKPRDTPPKGAGHVPLLKGISMAVDRRYIPLGATVLASIPSYNEKNKLIGHELKLLLAQDVGGAIKGAGHMDLYMGHADDAMEEASKYYHFGKVWILLPKNPSQNNNVNISLSEDINI